jgi:ferric-dicitrate binding protein FerR (iron transport regulator)
MIYLLGQYADNLSTPEETEELFDIIKASKEDENLYSFLEQEWTKLQPSLESEPDWNRMFNNIIGTKETGKVRLMKPWIKWSVAASIIVLLGIAYTIIATRHEKAPIAQTQDQRYKNDVNPGGYKARLTLADGTVIVLDSAAEGQLATQGQTAVLNKDGQLVYQSETGDVKRETIYNILSTAKGETYSVTLSDGTKVWLNSASSLRYPASFASSAVRQVEITGEAFFEVTHNAAKPFKVLVNGMEVEDLGTEFNINAYTDEPEIKTTLISGSVKVSAQLRDLSFSAVKIKPGEQAVSNPSNPVIRVQNNVNLEEVTSWKDNRFYFKSTDIKSLMRQLARWYDVEVTYEDVPATGFNARISRQTPISSILKALELTGEVKFRIEGKKITVFK